MTDTQESNQVPALFTPLSIRGVTLKNRIVISPMCQYSSEDGFANTWHVQHYGSRAVGGAALVIIEATAVSPEGRISPNDLGLWKNEHIVNLKNIVDFAHQQNSLIGIQLAHSGRKGSTHRLWESFGRSAIANEEGGFDVVGPSAVAFDEKHKIPAELSVKDIERIVSDFVEAAKRSVNAGMDVIELHFAHGYLASSFLSPKSNHRTDQYGGSFENRSRLLLDIVRAVRAVIPETMPLFARLSAVEHVEGGWDLDDTVNLSKLLKENGVDLVDCSSGGNSSDQKIPKEHQFQVAYAKRVKAEVGVTTGAVGGISDPRDANRFIEEDYADLILIARASLRDPYWPIRAAKVLNYNSFASAPQLLLGYIGVFDDMTKALGEVTKPAQ